MIDRKLEEPKQVLVVRKDLDMSVGKYGAQVSHASLGSIFSKMHREVVDTKVTYSFELDLEVGMDRAFDEWLNKRFTKIVVYVKSEQQLKNIHQKAIDKGLPCALIQDAGFTEFDEPTYTCLGIGPAYPEDFKGVTSRLSLYTGSVGGDT